MRILIWGLGHTGTVSAVGFAAMGHSVIGIDRDARIVDAFVAGRPLIHESGVDRLLRGALASGRVKASRSGSALVAGTDVVLVCVGTASANGETPSHEHLLDVARELGAGLRGAPPGCQVVLRSTVEVGFTRSVFIPALERHSGCRVGRDFSVAVVPELLREGDALEDFRGPPLIVLGLGDAEGARALEPLFEGVAAPRHVVTFEEAELFKLVNNAFHALKIGFANEVGRIGETFGVDAARVMELVCADRRPGSSTAYLRPGFAFGGSCLPKDLRALLSTDALRRMSLPILAGVLPSNEVHLEAACGRVRSLGVSCVGVAGLAFKPGTADLRGSASILLASKLRSEGLEVLLFDPDVDPDALAGPSSRFCEHHLPGFAKLFRRDAAAFVEEAEAVVITEAHLSLEPLRERCLAAGREVLVLAGAKAGVSVAMRVNGP
jgi:GDP-mannose 6-dehydrogenase